MKGSKELKKFQAEMRKKPTRAEKIFAEILKRCGVDFKQQMILGFFILDFVIPAKMLVFEIDGRSHIKKREYDRMRDNFIRKCGFSVIHVQNKKVGTFSIYHVIESFTDKSTKSFRSALAKANSLRGKSFGE